MGVASYWEYKPTNFIHADSPGVYTSESFTNLSKITKIHLKCVCIDGSVLNCVREPILYSFFSNKQPGYNVFCQNETVQKIKTNKYVLNTTTSCLENNNRKEVNSHGETLTFTL